jgi:hypothetical protein
LHKTVDHDARTQVTTDQTQQSLVTYLAGNATHQNVVLDSVETFRKIHIDAVAETLFDVTLYLLDGSVCGTLWSKTEARFGKVRIGDRRKNLQDGLFKTPNFVQGIYTP